MLASVDRNRNEILVIVAPRLQPPPTCHDYPHPLYPSETRLNASRLRGIGARKAAKAKGLPMKVHVHVSLKPGVLDPQGRAVHHALEGLGFVGVKDVRVGRLIELDVGDGTDDGALDEMCRKLLANTVIENYRIEKVA